MKWLESITWMWMSEEFCRIQNHETLCHNRFMEDLLPVDLGKLSLHMTHLRGNLWHIYAGKVHVGPCHAFDVLHTKGINVSLLGRHQLVEAHQWQPEEF